MRPTSAEADAARIRGTGRRWRGWWEFLDDFSPPRVKYLTL